MKKIIQVTKIKELFIRSYTFMVLTLKSLWVMLPEKITTITSIVVTIIVEVEADHVVMKARSCTVTTVAQRHGLLAPSPTVVIVLVASK